MAHKKGQGSSNNGRDSQSNRLGVKIFGGQFAQAGNIIIRQRGTKFHPGENVGMGKDHTIYALVDGDVTFTRRRKNRNFVSILPLEVEAAPAVKAAPKKAAPKKEEPVAEAPKKEAAPKADAPSAPADVDAAKADLIASLGEGSADDKDDLKKISGVGPVLEKTLNEIGIFKFSQVAKMTKTQYDLLDSITQKFPGRAERDDWAAQAKKLMEE